MANDPDTDEPLIDFFKAANINAVHRGPYSRMLMPSALPASAARSTAAATSASRPKCANASHASGSVSLAPSSWS